MIKTIRCPSRILLAGLIGLVFAACGGGEPAQPTAAAPASDMTNDIRQSTANVDGARIIAADAEPQNWLSHGRTYDEQRFSPLKQINEDTIDDPELNLLYIGAGNGAP